MSEILLFFVVGIIIVVMFRILAFAFRALIKIFDIGCGIATIIFIGFIFLALFISFFKI